MKSRPRRLCWSFAFAIGIAVFAQSLHAVDTPWASSTALGDVVVSFDGAVRVYGNADGLQKGGDITVAGSNRGIGFDSALNLFVTNTGAGQIVKLSPDDSHPVVTPNVPTQANPQSIVFAGDGTLYVASRTGSTQALIRRFTATAATCSSGVPSGSGTTCDFTVTVASGGTCVGIDLDANQKTVYIVDGASNPQPRLIRTLDVSNNQVSALPTAIASNQGIACGIRALPPERFSGATSTNGGFLVADKIDIKRLSPTGAQIGSSFTTGTVSNSDNNWIEVDLDPNTFDFWGLDAGELRAAKFRIAAPPNALQSISNLPGTPRGLTLNGALRAAQTIRLLNLAPSALGSALFLPDAPSYTHQFQITPPADQGLVLSIQAVEATSDGVTPPGESANPSGSTDAICPISVDVDCRINEFFTATAKPYSRNRGVFYMATQLVPFTSTQSVLVAIIAAGVKPSAGAACLPGGTTQPASALLRDPYPHTDPSLGTGYSVFSQDLTIVVAVDEVILKGRTTNHYIAANRTDTLFAAQLVKPAQDSTQQSGSTMQVAAVIQDPASNCSNPTGLEQTLQLAIADLTTKTVVLDTSQGIGVPINGVPFTSQNGQWRANLDLLPSQFPVGHKFRLVLSSNAGFGTDPNARAIGDLGADFTVKGKK
jgi:hypothetical protein